MGIKDSPTWKGAESSLWKGLSLFVLDPGETTGWSWCCVGRKELAQLGAVEAVKAASRHRSGAMGSDRRFMSGQVPLEGYASRVRSELEAAHDLYVQSVVCGNMASRTSGGVVQGITDVVLEDFILRERTQKRDLLSPVRLTAMVQAMVFSNDDYEASIHTLQSASNAKSTVTDDRLKRWDLWVPGQQHARDAIRHMILLLREIQNTL